MGLKKGKGSPKFIEIIDTNKKVPYSFRIEERVIDQLHSISGKLDISTSELLSNIIKDYLTEKTPYNNYLETFNSFIFDLPLNLGVKEVLTGRLKNKDNLDFKGFTDLDLKQELKDLEYKIGFYPDETLQSADSSRKYQVIRVPNNLDVFNKELETFTSSEANLKHQGLELLVVPELAKYTDNYIECLYCFYFTVDKDNISKMELINFTDIENLLIEKDNKYLITLAETIYFYLEQCNTPEEVVTIAETYNTDNIIPYGKEHNIEAKPFKVVLRENTPIIRQYDKELERKVEKLEKGLKKVEKDIKT